MDRNSFTQAFGLSLGLAGLILLPTLARAAPRAAPPQCAEHDAVATALSRQFSEQPHAIGLAQDATVMELYASPAGTWTLTVTLPTGMTCLVASGDNFETTAPAQVASGDPA